MWISGGTRASFRKIYISRLHRKTNKKLVTWISQGIRGILEKKCNQDTKKELKCSHLDISRNM